MHMNFRLFTRSGAKSLVHQGSTVCQHKSYHIYKEQHKALDETSRVQSYGFNHRQLMAVSTHKLKPKTAH